MDGGLIYEGRARAVFPILFGVYRLRTLHGLYVTGISHLHARSLYRPGRPHLEAPVAIDWVA